MRGLAGGDDRSDGCWNRSKLYRDGGMADDVEKLELFDDPDCVRWRGSGVLGLSAWYRASPGGNGESEIERCHGTLPSDFRRC